MPAVVPDYEYDIFISYRHNDNRSGWVTDFTSALQEELGATVKEPLSIYFDRNPHDGLLETHHVDKSLEGKLKCLIFIPIISQTYCDPKSFAWRSEFCVFKKLANNDQYGRDIKLRNGNVASRILPVMIHDLDAADRGTIERETGGPLRAIEFIYKEPGVNRALAQDDKKDENLLKTSYRNQVNKVANAVKEILLAIQNNEKDVDVVGKGAVKVSGARQEPVHLVSTKGFKLAGAILAIIIIGVMAYLFYKPAGVAQHTDNTILVLPFESDALDNDQSYFAKGITSDIIIEIGKARNLSPLSWHTSFGYADTKKSLREVAEETNARYILSGSVQRVANKLRLHIELADPFSNKTIWSDRFDRELHEILDVQKEIALDVAGALDVRLSDSEKKSIGRYKTKSFEAYDLFLQAEVISRTLQLDIRQFEKCQALLEEAIAIDPGFAEAYVLYAHNIIEITTYADKDAIEMGKKAEAAVLKAIELYPSLPDSYIVLGAVNFYLKWDMKEADRNFEKGWAMANEGSNSLYHCLCSFSQYKLVKGHFGEVIEFINTIKKSDPVYPYEELEKFPAYYGLQDTAGMKTIRAIGRPKFIVPAFDYYLGDYLKSANGFEKDVPFLYIASLGSAFYKAGLKQKSDSLLSVVLDQPDAAPHKDIHLAQIYGARGDKKNALKWYLKAVEGHDYLILYVRVIPDLKFLLDEPEVKDIYNEIGI